MHALSVRPKVEHLTATERAAKGRAARAAAPRASQSALDLPDRDPVALLEEQATTRVSKLVPIRYGRMLVSPFTFYRAPRDHGPRSGGRAGLRAPGTALRRHPSLQLRRLRLGRALARLRPQRLRRGASGTVRMGREAPRSRSCSRESTHGEPLTSSASSALLRRPDSWKTPTWTSSRATGEERSTRPRTHSTP